MGKGDKKSRRGKIILGTYGKRRPRKTDKPAVNPVKEVLVKEPKKKEAGHTAAEKEHKSETKPVKEAKVPKEKAPKVQKEKKESSEKKDKKS